MVSKVGYDLYLYFIIIWKDQLVNKYIEMICYFNHMRINLLQISFWNTVTGLV